MAGTSPATVRRTASTGSAGGKIKPGDRMMPYVNVQITTGASRAQKEALVREITSTLNRVLGKKPEHTHIVIQEIPDENWGFAGVLTDDFRKSDEKPVTTR